MWVQPNLLAAHLFFFLSPLGLQPAEVFKIKTCGAGQLFLLRESREGGVLVLRFFVSGAVRRAGRFF